MWMASIMVTKTDKLFWIVRAPRSPLNHVADAGGAEATERDFKKLAEQLRLIALFVARTSW